MDSVQIRVNKLEDEVMDIKKKHSEDKSKIYDRINKIDDRCHDLEKVDIETNGKIDRLIEKMDEVVDIFTTIQKEMVELQKQASHDRDGEKWRHYSKVAAGAMLTGVIGYLLGVILKTQ